MAAAPSKDSTALPTDRTRPWVFYGGVPWSTPWLNDQQLAHALAAEQPVLYVEPPRSPLSDPSERILRPRIRQAEGGVHVLTTIALPKVGSERSQRLSAPLVRAQVRWAVRRWKRPVAAAAAMGPQARRYKGAAAERVFIAFVSDWLEAGGDLLHQERSDLAAASLAFWQAADLICVTSRPLGEVLRSRGFDSSLLEHGFDDSVAPVYDAARQPDEYAEAGTPIMAVAGRLNRRLDVELLDELATRYSHGSLFLIGPVVGRDAPRLEELLGRSNVLHIPTRGREQLPAYLRHADVLLVPYVADEWSRYSSPMKVWDYLYAGAPIVGQGCPPLRDLGEPIAYHAGTRQEFHAAIQRALAVDDRSALSARRRALARDNTWRARASQLRTLVAESSSVTSRAQ